ncbi:hypothetical protein M5689_022959 [Euphorbia peplus]|nr:hypothetical protein M5689_022959 [Euphorbia peplus]
MSTKSSTSLTLSFLFIVLVIASYVEKAKASYDVARGPVGFGCSTTADCVPSKCFCSSPCRCTGTNEICGEKTAGCKYPSICQCPACKCDTLKHTCFCG